MKLLSPFHLFVGTTLLVAAVQNHLTPLRHPMFIADITFCYLTALLTGLPLLGTSGSR